MSALLVIQEYTPTYGNIVPLYVEGVADRQTRMLIDNADSIAGKLEGMIDDLDYNVNETIELSLLGANIYVDVLTKGFDCRRIELLGVEIINNDGDSLEQASQLFFNLLECKVQRLNDESEALFESR